MRQSWPPKFHDDAAAVGSNGVVAVQTRRRFRRPRGEPLGREASDLCGFRFTEFASKGNGWIRVHRELVRGLEEYRELVDGPVVVVSGYRDKAHNTKVGGAPSSQHLYGNAVDSTRRRAQVLSG